MLQILRLYTFMVNVVKRMQSFYSMYALVNAMMEHKTKPEPIF
jgi:hypothetical protein